MLDQVIYLAQQAMILVLVCSAPPIAASLLVSFVTAVLQSVTQIQDPALTSVPRMVAVYGSLIVAGPWIGEQLVEFATAAFDMMAMVA